MKKNQDEILSELALHKNAKDIGMIIGNLFLCEGLCDLLKEELLLKKISSMADVSIEKYIEKMCNINRYAKRAFQKKDEVIENIRDVLSDITGEPDVEVTRKKCFYEKMGDVFNSYYIGQKRKKTAFDKIDGDGFYDCFPASLKTFIKNSFAAFNTISDIPESYEPIDFFDANHDKQTDKLSFYNRIGIIILIISGKVKAGDDITKKLFKALPQKTKIPLSFLRLCDIQKNKYILCNDDCGSIDFFAAVFDLMRFVDCDNKSLLNNKIKQLKIKELLKKS